jgi:hypothetical protein
MRLLYKSARPAASQNMWGAEPDPLMEDEDLESFVQAL